jgi:hypothetical protein
MESQVLHKKEIVHLLHVQHDDFINYINGLDENAFHFSYEKKWTAGQQLDHIYRSVSTLNLILRLPIWFLRWYFPKANRPSRTFSELVSRYHQKLEKGGKASGRFVPQLVPIYKRQGLSEKLNRSVVRLGKLIQKFSEKELDTMILPHPLLGKITIREMGYFTIYHVQHHEAITKRNLEKLPVGASTLMQY